MSRGTKRQQPQQPQPETQQDLQGEGEGRFGGHQPRACGEHRTVGEHRAWCHDCGEWCYPYDGCIRCRHPES